MHSTLHIWRRTLAGFSFALIFAAGLVPASGPAIAQPGHTPLRGSLADAPIDSLPNKLPLVDGQDIQFRRISRGARLSQTRVASAVQDGLGFMWFGTQYGLDRYDGYNSKVFKHELGHPDSLSCVFIRSLFVDRSGTLWVGCDRFLDKFDPVTETFRHYSIDTQDPDRISTPIDRITSDRAGILWLATSRGLYKFDPATGQTTRYAHDPADPQSIGGNDINYAGEDRSRRFWIGNGGGLDEFDRKTGKVIRHVPFRSWVGEVHEDKYGIIWIASISSYCALSTLNLKTNLATCHSLDPNSIGTKSPINVSRMLESRDGTLWVGSSAGMLKLDREHRRFVRYHNDPTDIESPESDNVISLYQDNEGNIWTCYQETEPSYFSEAPQAFEKFTHQRGNLVGSLVTSIYEDRRGILWIGSMGGLNRIDRKTQTNTVPAGAGVGNEILDIREDPSGVLFSGTFHQGLLRLDTETGKLSPYVRNGSTSNVAKNPIMRLMYDHEGILWAATYGGVSRFDRATGNFTTYTPEKQNTIQYQEIKEDSQGFLWLGAQSGLHRFDPRTGQFTVYEHDPDNPRSLSDNRVNSVHFDRSGNMWIGTQNGLDKFEPGTKTFKTYFEQNGLAGDVVSCILEDKHGVLWMGTNNGLSSFDPQSQRFRNFSAADGLPGPDLTGWGSCYESPSGEMFFGGFSGATAFYPSQILNNPFVPRTVLTDFRLSGNPVAIGPDSPLKQSITYTDAITLSHRQNIFSIEFSALSYFNSATNRYRYRLDGLDDQWHEVGGDERTASYTTLPTGAYTFHVQSATSRGKWSEPGASLRIEILPAWYQTALFRIACAVFVLACLWFIYQFRLKQLEHEFKTALEARVDERTRIARDLHDTLLQSFNALLLRFQAASNLLPSRPEEAKQRVDNAIEQASNAITEGRDAVHELRSGGLASIDLAQSIRNFAKELLGHPSSESLPELSVQVEGAPRELNPIVRDEAYRIAAEALRNAIRHAGAQTLEVEIRYDQDKLCLRVRDDGKGIDPGVLGKEHAPGHWGLRGMRERATLIGGTFEVWSEVDSGTEVELRIPAANAYAKPTPRRRFDLRSRRRS
jgi:signal transduction histidine kinase/ligand-binding sensor domain-containing protein